VNCYFQRRYTLKAERVKRALHDLPSGAEFERTRRRLQRRYSILMSLANGTGEGY
jgi:hypothetical protein